MNTFLYGFFLAALLLRFTLSFSQQRSSENIKDSKIKDTGYEFAFTEATKMFLFGDYARAASLYNECIKYEPESAAAHYQLAEIFLKTGDINSAKLFALRAFYLAPDNKWYVLQVANIYQSIQMTDSAVFMYRKLITGTRQDINIFYQISSLLEKSRDYSGALEYLNKIEEMVGTTRETLVGKSRIFESQGRQKEALEQLRLALKVQEDDYIIKGMIAEHFRMHQMNDSAELYYLKIFKDHLDDANVVFSYGEFLLSQNRLSEAKYVYVALYKNVRVDESIKVRYLYNAIQNQEVFMRVRPVLDTLAILMMGNYPDNLNIMSLYSDVNYRLGKYKEASEVLKLIIGKDVNNFKAWEQLLFCQSALENRDSVLFYGEQAVRKFESRPLPYLILSSAYYSNKEYEKALVLLKKGEPYMDSDPVKIEYYSLMAECYNKSDPEIADNYYEAALEIDSLNVALMNNYAYSLAVRGQNLLKAKKMSGYTINDQPKNPTFLDTYAWVVFKNGEVRKAKKYIKKAIINGGNKNPEILEHYGDILFKLGMRQKAILKWKEALQYGDTDTQKGLRLKIAEVSNK